MYPRILTKIGGDRETVCITKDQPAIAWEIIISKDTLDSLRLPNLGQAGSGEYQEPTAGPRAERSGCSQTACFVKGSAQGPQKTPKSIRKTVFSHRNRVFQLLKATQTHQNPVENPAPPRDRPRRVPDPPGVLPEHPRTSRSTGKIREPTGDRFFGARNGFPGSETLPNAPKPARNDPKTEPHRRTSRRGPQNRPSGFPDSPGCLGVRGKSGGRPGTGFFLATGNPRSDTWVGNMLVLKKLQFTCGVKREWVWAALVLEQ